jgi:hypothetical protein
VFGEGDGGVEFVEVGGGYGSWGHGCRA